jgi:hypothetical protein
LLCGFAVLPFVGATALAQPMQLSEKQMDQVTAGQTFLGKDFVTIVNSTPLALSVARPPHTVFVDAIIAEHINGPIVITYIFGNDHGADAP